MKVGDLVRCVEIVGIVVKLPVVGGMRDKQRPARVGVLWAGKSTVDWEPRHWLEVINESR